MNTLFLVDVDNLLDDNGAPNIVSRCLRNINGTLPQIPQGRRGAIDRTAVERHVVVLGMNTASAWNFADFPQLQKLAGGIVLKVLGAQSASPLVEVILTLSMPEAADRALCLSLSSASSNATAGPFHRVVLISGDASLRDWVKSRMPGDVPANVSHQQNSRNVYIFPTRTPRSRTAPPAPQSASGKAPFPTTWIAINTPQLCQQVSKEIPQFPQQISLRELGLLVEKHPGLLTQVGLGLPGNGALRGANRLKAVLNKTPITLASHSEDGLEYYSREPRNSPILSESTMSASVVYPGALVTEWNVPPERMILRTRLPFEVANRLRPSAPISPIPENHPVSLPDEALLELALQIHAGPLRALTYRFCQRDARICCELLLVDPTVAPTSWWVYLKESDRIKSDAFKPKYSCTIKYKSRPTDIQVWARWDVIGQATVASIEGNAELVVRSPLRIGDSVTVQGEPVRYQLLPCVSSESLACAYLELGARLRVAGQPIPCVAIQEVSSDVLEKLLQRNREICEELRRLPIVVPLDAVEQFWATMSGE